MGESIFGVFGCGGFAREVMPIARQFLADRPDYGIAPDHMAFIDRLRQDAPVNGHAVLSEDDFAAHPAAHKYFCVAVGDGRLRQTITARALSAGHRLLSLTSRHAVVMDGSSIGDGAILCHFSTVTANVTIGRSFKCDNHAAVAHDCVIGDFVTFAPGAKCNGNVVIEDFVTIGSGAVIRQGTPERPLRIGAGATIGMGAVVIRDVPAGATVIGNPARILAP